MAVKKSSRWREKRASTRVDARLSMRVETPRESGLPAQVVTESQNISSSGVYCMCTQYLPPLSKVLLTIVLPRIPGRSGGQELIKCEGIVVRCEAAASRRGETSYQLACMFASLAQGHRERIEEFVTWRNLQALRAAVAPPKRAVAKRAPRKKATARPRKATTRATAARRTASAGAKRRSR